MVVKQIEYRGKQIKIFYDEFAESPREWGNLGTMYCLHKRYNLGDEHDFESSDILDIYDDKDNISLMLYIYDHTGVAMFTEKSKQSQYSGWDTSCVGIITVSKEKVLREFGKKRLSKKLRNKVIDILLSEVKVYSYYFNGNVYGYKIKGIDSCGGFYGFDYEENGLLDHAKSSIDWYIKEERKKHFDLVKSYINHNVSLECRKPLKV